MRFGHIELRVADPLRSLAFYRDVLGFDLVQNQDDRFVWVRLGTTEILLRPGDPVVRGLDFASCAHNLALYTRDLSTTRQRLEEAGVTFAGEEQGCPLFRDPDGNWLQLVEQS